MPKFKLLYYKLAAVIQKQWRKRWVKRTILETLELVAIGILTYFIQVLTHETNFDVAMLTVVILKAILVIMRSHPSIPVTDYINKDNP